MDLPTVFYLLGSVFFFLSLVIMVAVTVSLIYFFVQFKKTTNNIKESIEYAKSLKGITDKLPAFVLPLLVIFAKFVFNKIKERFDA